MPFRWVAASAALVAGYALAAAGASAPDGTFDASAFLRTYAGFSSNDLARIAAGTPVARTLSADADEVAISGAAVMSVSREFYLERFKDIAAFKRNPLVLSIGRFGSPPSAADLRELSLNDEDLSALKRCYPGSCDVRLDPKGLARIRDLSRDGDGAGLTAALREHLAAYTAEYAARGDAALMEYHDHSRPRRIAADLALILKKSPYFDRELAAMRADVVNFQGVGKSTNGHMLYWSNEKIAGTPVLTLTHAVIGTPATGVTAITTRQIYASHFFHASLGLTLLCDTPSAKGPGVTVIYINRSRVDAFSGLLGPVKRAAVRSRARTTTERMLAGLRTRLESAQK